MCFEDMYLTELHCHLILKYFISFFPLFGMTTFSEDDHKCDASYIGRWKQNSII